MCSLKNRYICNEHGSVYSSCPYSFSLYYLLAVLLVKRLKYLLWLVVVFVLILLGYGVVCYVQLLENSFEASISPIDPVYRMANHPVCLPDSIVSERERELFYIAKVYLSLIHISEPTRPY